MVWLLKQMVKSDSLHYFFFCFFPNFFLAFFIFDFLLVPNQSVNLGEGNKDHACTMPIKKNLTHEANIFKKTALWIIEPTTCRKLLSFQTTILKKHICHHCSKTYYIIWRLKSLLHKF